ncbi:MAG: hypothetical protein ACK6D3_00170 [Planctomycetaceae bacterium]
MAGELTRRSMLAAGLGAAGALTTTQVRAAADAAEGRLDLDGLSKALKAAGIKAKAREKAFDFSYVEKDAVGEEWTLSMSAVLSNDEETVWLMAWLDELPQSSADVPRTALLRLLADNDMIGNGIFFAYVKSNRRFILQRVLKNAALTATSLKSDLDELGFAVMNTYAHWAVKNWKSLSGTTETAAAAAAKETEADEAVKPSAGGVSRTATRDAGTTGKSRK